VNSPTASKIQRAYNDVGKLLRSRDRFVLTIAHDAPGDLSRPSLLSKFKDQICEFALWKSIHQIGRRFFAALIHSHIERRVGGEAKTPVTSVELNRRYAEIRENPSSLAYSRFGKHRGYSFEVRMKELNSIFKDRQTSARRSERIEILVYPNNASVGRSRKHRERMSAGSDSAIDKHAPSLRLKPLDDLFE
jgi:hypothetical protein